MAIQNKCDIEEHLLVRACKDFHIRRTNNGDWIRGVPDSWVEVRDKYLPHIKGDLNQWLAVENFILSNSAMFIANFFVHLD